MRVIPWTEWLDKHIPYYEAERFRKEFETNPPQVVLEIDIVDRFNRGPSWRDWHTVNDLFEKYHTEPLFLERDTRQKWYWAFWNEKDVLLVLMML